MCEFCTAHGEGRKWYLQMKNYAKELLSEELSSREKKIVKVKTRREWTLRFWEGFVMPAMKGLPSDQGVQPFVTEDVEGQKVEHFGQVLPLEDVEQVIDMVDSITRLPCGCRFISIGKADKRYCFGIGIDKWGILGKYPDATSSLEVLDKEEVKKIFRQYDEEGLVHTIWTGVTPYVLGMCNCDRDCNAYRGYLGGAPDFFRAEYVCQVDWDLCTGCKSCMKQCQFGAQFYSSALSRVYVDPTRCFGCGVCRAACPHEAIRLLPRQENPEAADIWLGHGNQVLS